MSFWGEKRRFQKKLLILTALLFILHLLFDGLRWQLLFVYFLLVLLSLLYFKKKRIHILLRSVCFIFALLLVGVSAFYASYMPITELPAPSGAYTVGHTSLILPTRSPLKPFAGKTTEGRRLLVEIWYPAKKTSGKKAVSIWSGLYSGKKDIVSFLTGYLKNISTHSYPNIEAVDNASPLIVFNHGLQMFTAQNTLLMEHLASHGYIIASIGHPEQSIRIDYGDQVILPEFIRSLDQFKRGMQWIQESSAPINALRKRIKTIKNSEEKATLLAETLARATELNEIVNQWCQDSRLVMDYLLDKKPHLKNKLPQIDPNKIGVMGMSLGGAVAEDLAKTEPRIKAGINIDGLHYGKTQNDSLMVPFMIINSDDGTGLNDMIALKSSDEFYDYHIKGSKHADLTDMVVLWPILKIYGQAGELPSTTTVNTLNNSILKFWDRFLGENDMIDLTHSPIPELIISAIEQ